jgi:hypothetical protein
MIAFKAHSAVAASNVLYEYYFVVIGLTFHSLSQVID